MLKLSAKKRLLKRPKTRIQWKQGSILMVGSDEDNFPGS